MAPLVRVIAECYFNAFSLTVPLPQRLPPAEPTLASTGFATEPLGLASLMLLAAGVVLVLGKHRRA